MTGFVRLEPETVASFASTLSQLRANPLTARKAAPLTGFFHELIHTLPVSSVDDVPALRWCDLWSHAMLDAVKTADLPETGVVSGTLYPLGVELRQHARMASVVVYGILLNNGEPQFVRQTWSAYKATAIQGDDVWLLFPEAQMLLQHLLQGTTIKVHDMPMLPPGDLLWRADAAETGKKFKLLEIALQYCSIGHPLKVAPVPALERHPVHLAEPVALTEYRIENNCLHLKDEVVLALDTQRSGLSSEALAATTALFGLLRFDNGVWSVQALTAGNPIGKFEFVGQLGAELLKKPPKTSAVSVLQERASRLLRK